jgi:TPR repeat protein
MEQGEHWFNGTDAKAFQRFKEWVDTEEDKKEQEHLHNAEELVSWMSLLQEAQGEINPTVASAIVKSANDGDVEAMKLAAALFLSGKCVKKSVLKGLQYAIASKDFLLGQLKVYGEGADPWERGQACEAQDEIEKAVHFYQLAAENGNPSAMWRWGTLLIRSDEGMHFAEGVQLLEAAGELGVSEAWFELGQLYLEGDFLPFDQEKAVAYLKKASDLKHVDAAMALAVYHHERLEFADAVKYYRAAEKDGNTDATVVVDALSSRFGA